LTDPLRFAPGVTLALFLAPIAAGLIGTLLPAFGYLPALGATTLSLEPWRTLLAWPGFATALRLSMTIGIGASVGALGLAIGFCALAQDRAWLRRCERLLAPLLASPHAAMAIGFAFLIAPSGWLVRLISLAFTGWLRPPVWLVTVQDSFGLACIGGLLLKETPYLVLMILAALTQVPVRPMLASARAMGYRGATAWLKVVLPVVYPQIRLPVYAVLAFSLSVVDVSLILGPSDPPPLAVLAARWFADYDLSLYGPAAAAATLQLLLVVLCIGVWRSGEIIAAWLGRHWIERGGRAGVVGPVIVGGGTIAMTGGVLGFLCLAGMALWSVAQVWRFPDALPSRWSLATWTDHAGSVVASATQTMEIAALAALVALVLTLACLENEQRRGLRPGVNALWLLYLPLLVPQIAFLFGVQIVLVRLDLDGRLLAVVWAHLLFVLPYVFLSLADPFRALDPRYARSAAGLGVGRARVFWRLKLPMLLRPVLVAFAVGFSISVGQYLPTLFAGAGRIATLTTDAVTLASGADRRVVGAFAFLQSVLPLIIYGTALAIPRLVFRHRRGLA
jgi:putative thiamine transport system permease protein